MPTVKTRNWSEYNEKLVKRGEFYINPQFLETWIDEIKEMNHRKIGNPYLYPESMIEFLAILHAKSFDYRSLQGIMNALSKNIAPFPVISYTQICRRINSLDLNFNVSSDDLIVAVDGTGFKVSNRGEWIREKWAIKRGWIKIVIMGTPNGKSIDIRVGTETLDERKAGRGMLRKNNKVRKAIFDGLHDCKDTFNLCEQLKVEPVIKVRKNASSRAHGSAARKKAVLRYKELGHKRWCEQSSYDLRWPATEGIFSSVKRMFGEGVRSTKKQNMYKEAKRKFWAYNKVLANG